MPSLKRGQLTSTSSQPRASSWAAAASTEAFTAGSSPSAAKHSRTMPTRNPLMGWSRAAT